MPASIAILPVKPFDRAKERLALDPKARSAFAEETATRVVVACLAAGLEAVVVTGDTRVRSWAGYNGAAVIDDPGLGLDGAAAAGVVTALAAGRGWLVIHADLPLLTSADLAGIPQAIEAGITVIAPSPDGGTKLLGSVDEIPFRYGPRSFERHVAVIGGRPRIVLVRAGTAIEVDTIEDLMVASRLAGGSWMRRFVVRGS